MKAFLSLRALSFLPRVLLMALVMALVIVPKGVVAEPVQLVHKGLKLNGNLSIAEEKKERIFLLVHGTWAHGGMEIISSLQSLLHETDENSLAITLSLGVDNRSGFMTCEKPILARHDAAVDEIQHWVEYLSQSWTEVIIVGHSRGANQVALFSQKMAKEALQDGMQEGLRESSNLVSKTVLIAPMAWVQTDAAYGYEKRYAQNMDDLLLQAQEHKGEFFKASIINCKDVMVSAESFLSYYSNQPNRNTPELLSKVKQPSLVVLGSEDELSKKFQRYSVGLERDEKIDEVWIEGAGHFFRDFYADELVELMLEWVAK